MRLLPILIVLGCGSSNSLTEGPRGAFTIRYEPVIDAHPGMRLSFGDDTAWVVVDNELTAYDADWGQTMRIGGVSAVGAVLDVGVWLTNDLVVRSVAGAGGIPVSIPVELGTPLDLRRGDGGELWLMGQTAAGGTLASSLDAGETWRMQATDLTADGTNPETLELRNTLGGIVVVVATDSATGSSTTWKVTGSGAEDWEDGSFLTYPDAVVPGGWATTLPDNRPQYDATTAGWADTWSPTEPDRWGWTHGVGLDLAQDRVGLEVVGADSTGVLYAHDETTLYRTTMPFTPDHDEPQVPGGPGNCDDRYDIDWSVALSETAKETRVRNGLTEELLLFELFEDGLRPLSEGPIAPESGTGVVVRLESWLMATDLDGRCLALLQGAKLKAGEHWFE